MGLGKFLKHGSNDLFDYLLRGTEPVTLYSFTEKKKFAHPHVGMQSARTANVRVWERITVQVVPLGGGMK